MFVSSYSTHIQTSNSDKVAKQQQLDKRESNAKSFSEKLSSTSQPRSFKTSNIPVDYISKGLVLNNKQELENKQNNTKNETKNNLNKFTTKNSLINAKNAYEGNSKMFSLFTIPNIALNQTPSVEQTLPKEPQDIKELNMRHKMVNTYLANDNYYKVTA